MKQCLQRCLFTNNLSVNETQKKIICLQAIILFSNIKPVILQSGLLVNYVLTLLKLRST